MLMNPVVADSPGIYSAIEQLFESLSGLREFVQFIAPVLAEKSSNAMAKHPDAIKLFQALAEFADQSWLST